MNEPLLTRLKQLGYKSLTKGIALHPVSKALGENETILILIESLHLNTVGALIATDYRIFYAGITKHKKSIFSQIGYNDIKRIKIGSLGLVSVELLLVLKNGKQLRFKACDMAEANSFIEIIKLLTLNSLDSTEI